MKAKFIIFIFILLLINCNTFAQKGHSINSNSIIRQLPRINHSVNRNSNAQNHSNRSVFGNQKQNHSNNEPKQERVKEVPKNKPNKNEQNSKPNKPKKEK